MSSLNNQSLLVTTSTLFLLFALSEIVGAALSHSLSLFGDAAAMCVDVLTYFFNMYAEWYKAKLRNHSIALVQAANEDNLNRTDHTAAHRHNEALIFQTRVVFEVVIPSISVTCLLLVTIFVSVDAAMLLRNPPLKDDVNVEYLYVYAALNLVVDLTCTGLFYLKNLRSGDLFVEDDYLQEGDLDDDEEEQVSAGSEEDEEVGDEKSGSVQLNAISSNNKTVAGKGHSSPQSSSSHAAVTTKAINTASTCTHCSSADSNSSSPSSNSSSVKRRAKRLWIRCARSSDNLLQPEQASESPGDSPQPTGSRGRSKKNINMLSAFTHILGDTLRTIAVFAAALVSTATGIDGDKCDAVAAIVVSFTILYLLTNILREIVEAGLDIWRSAPQPLPSPHPQTLPLTPHSLHTVPTASSTPNKDGVNSSFSSPDRLNLSRVSANSTYSSLQNADDDDDD